MIGKILKGIAGFYYVHVAGAGIYECKAKGVFRRQKLKPLVGDDVRIAIIDEQEKTGNVESICTRRNELFRPAVANIDMALVIFAAASPQPNLNLLDRFLILMQMQQVPVTICFNKMDLAEAGEREQLAQIYGSCGHPVLFTCAAVPEQPACAAGERSVPAGIEQPAGRSRAPEMPSDSMKGLECFEQSAFRPGAPEEPLVSTEASAVIEQSAGRPGAPERPSGSLEGTECFEQSAGRPGATERPSDSREASAVVEQSAGRPGAPERPSDSMMGSECVEQPGTVGIAELKQVLAGKTSAVAGPSGVGKSSLINLLQQGIQMETGEVSRKIGRGKQTTRHTQLIHIEDDTYIMDTPGFSSLFLPEMEKEELKQYYPEFTPYEEECRFQGCSHVSEPGCAVKQALQAGHISQKRYENYCQLFEELKGRRKY